MKVLGAFILVTFFCAVGYGQETERKVFTAIAGPDGVQHVSVYSGEYFFDPNYIIVKVNMPVELSISKTSGIVPHALVLEAPDAGISIHEKITAEPKVINFTPTKTGKYQFYCDKKVLFFKSHREQGMEGVLEVVE